MAYRKFTPRWSLTSEDARMSSWYFNTGGNADSEDDVEAAFDTFWNAIKAWYGPSTVLDEYRWYFSASLVPRGSPWGDSARTIDRNSAGTGNVNMLPPQCAVVVTYPRPSPHKRHPGRNYLPAPLVSATTTDGRLHTSVMDAIANAAEAFLEACVAVGYQPVTVAKIQGVDSALIIPKLRVDNVFDTQRRRGYELYTAAAEREVTTIP